MLRQKVLDLRFDVMEVQGLGCGFHCEEEVFAGVEIVIVVLLEFLDGVFGVGWIVHHAKMFPVELLASADVQAKEVWMDGQSVF